MSIHLVTNSEGGAVSLHSMLAKSLQKLKAIARHKAGGYSLSGAVLYCPDESLPIDAPCGRCGESLPPCKSISSVGKPRTKKVVGFAVAAPNKPWEREIKRIPGNVRIIRRIGKRQMLTSSGSSRVFWMLKEACSCTHCKGSEAFKSETKE